MDPSKFVVNPNKVWYDKLVDCMSFGCWSSPRGMKILELINQTYRVDMLQPMITNKHRQLNYAFMAAEAYWILCGSDRLNWLTPYCKTMARFSDDGHILAGAYGPRISRQIPYIVNTLLDDHESRQAVLTIWTERPTPSKDIPCTISMQFLVRKQSLHLIVNMRSNDLWLGMPYDMFSFSMVGIYVALKLKPYLQTVPGLLHVNVGSMHLYEKDKPGVEKILASEEHGDIKGIQYTSLNDPDHLLNLLGSRRMCPRHEPFNL